MIKKNYDIHGILSLSVEGNKKLIDEIDYHLVFFQTDKIIQNPDISITPYQEPTFSIDTCFDDYKYSCSNLWRAETKFSMNCEELPHIYKIDRLVLPINLIIQIGLVAKGFTFVHAAGVIWNGMASVFCAFPGTGKTTLLSVMVKAGAQILGDDLCIIGNGSVYSYPQVLTIYYHHLPLFPNLPLKTVRALRWASITRYILRMLPNTGYIRKLSNVIVARAFPEYCNVPLEHIYSTDQIANFSKLNNFVSFERSDVDRIIAKKINRNRMITQINTILWHEWHGSFHELLIYESLLEKEGWLDTLMAKSKIVIDNSMKDDPSIKLMVPFSWNSEKLGAELHNKLKNNKSNNINSLVDILTIREYV